MYWSANIPPIIEKKPNNPIKAWTMDVDVSSSKFNLNFKYIGSIANVGE